MDTLEWTTIFYFNRPLLSSAHFHIMATSVTASFFGKGEMMMQPLSGLRIFTNWGPRVAPPSRPWAGGWNLVEVLRVGAFESGGSLVTSAPCRKPSGGGN